MKMWDGIETPVACDYYRVQDYDMDASLQSTILRQRKIIFWDEYKYTIHYYPIYDLQCDLAPWPQGVWV